MANPNPWQELVTWSTFRTQGWNFKIKTEHGDAVLQVNAQWHADRNDLAISRNQVNQLNTQIQILQNANQFQQSTENTLRLQNQAKDAEIVKLGIEAQASKTQREREAQDWAKERLSFENQLQTLGLEKANLQSQLDELEQRVKLFVVEMQETQAKAAEKLLTPIPGRTQAAPVAPVPFGSTVPFDPNGTLSPDPPTSTNSSGSDNK